MIQQQIEQFTRSLHTIAREYSDPSVLIQHIPVLKDFRVLQANPEYLFYGIGSIIGLFFLHRIVKQRQAARVKNVALVMPKPYLGEADDMRVVQGEADGLDKEGLRQSLQAEESALSDALEQDEPSPQIAPRQNSEPDKRSAAQQLEDVKAVSLLARAALTPGEARMRVLVQAVLNEFGAGYMIMARTALAALLEPGRDAAGRERALAIAAIEGKYLDFGVFDRAGRCVLALEITNAEPEIGTRALDRAIVQNALAQANVPLARLISADTPVDVRSKIAPYLRPIAQGQVPSAPQSATGCNTGRKPGRPARPLRPAHAAAISAQ